MTEEIGNKTQLTWKKYGTALTVVICLILVTVMGWQYWEKRQTQNNLQAANLYQKMVLISQNVSSDNQTITSQAQNIIKLYPDSIYADFSRLEIVKQAVKRDNLTMAKLNLMYITKNSLNPNLKTIAALRLARIEIAQNTPDKAIQTLKEIKKQGYSLSKMSILGDAYFAKKDYKNAKSCWEIAQKNATKPRLANINKILQMKIDNLAALTSRP